LDSLKITANLYEEEEDRPIIVLCHQAGFNKVEYSKIGKTLAEEGYNCLSIDQRRGGHILESFNETLLAAEEKNRPVDFLV
jgi:hypothetical protein